MTEFVEEFTSLSEAAKYAHTCRQAIFLAIRKNQLKAEKRVIKNARGNWAEQWVVKRSDLDDYRKSKYNREKRVVDGQKLFDIEEDRLSVLHAAKILSEALNTFYAVHRLYYLLRIGRIRGFKKAGAWIIRREDLIGIYHLESGSGGHLKVAT
jgi:hypothetical protein